MANNDLGTQLSQLTEMKALISELPKMFEKLGTSIGGQTDPLRRLTESMEEATDTEGLKDMDAALRDLSKGFGESRAEAKLFSKKVIGLGAAAATAKGAFNGFTQGLSGTFSMIGSLTSSVFNLAKGAVGALVGSWEGLIGQAYALRDAGDSVAKEFEKIKNDFGSLAKNEGKAVVDAFKQLRSAGGFAAQTGMSLRFVFGGEFTAALSDVITVAKGMGTTFGQLKDEFVQNATALVVMNRGLGMSGEALAGLTLQARAAGESMTEALTETMQQVTHLENQFGIDGKLIAKNLDTMAKNMTKFGHMSREQLTATAAYATKLGVSIESLGSVFDKFENFEEAATGAAKMAEAFGMNVDAMAMMNAESPAEQMDMMRNAFMETGKSLDDLSRTEKSYLEELTGLKGDELYKAFDPANADIGFDDMLDAANEAAEKVSPEEAMMNAAEKIEKAFDRMAEKSKGFFDAFTKGFMKGATHAAMMNNPLKKLTASLDKVYRIGYELAKSLFGPKGAFSPANSKLLKDFNKILDNAVNFFQDLSDEIKSLAKGEITFETFIDNMLGHTQDFFHDSAFNDFGSLILEKINNGINFVLQQIPSILDSLASMFDPNSAKTKFDPIGEIFGDDKIKTSFKKIGATLVRNWPAIQNSLMNLFNKVGEAFITWAETPQGQKTLKIVAAILFGPAAIKGAIGGVTSAIGFLLTSALAAAMKNPKRFFGAVKNFFVKGFKGVPKAFKGFFKILKKGGRGLLKVGKFLRGLITPLARLSKALVIKGFRGVVKGFRGFFKILGKGGRAIGKVGKFLGRLIKPLGKLSKVLLRMGGKLFSKVWAPIQLIISGGKAVIRFFNDAKAIISGAGSVFEKVGNVIEAFFGRLFFGAMDFVAATTDLIDFVAGGFLGMFGIELPSLTTWLFGEGGPEEIYKMFTEIDWGYIPEMFNTLLWTPFKETMSGAYTKVKDIATGIYKKFTGINVGKIVTGLVDGFNGMAGKIKDKFSQAATGAKDAFFSIFRIDSPSKVMEEAAGYLNDGLSGGLNFGDVMKGAAELGNKAFELAMNPGQLIDTVSAMLPSVEGLIDNAKSLVGDGVHAIADGISTVTNGLADMAPIAADAMVTKVANGLAGDGSVAVQHEGLNIQVHFKVNIDSKDLAAALGDDAEGGPFFVINTDRDGGGTESAEAAGE